MATKFFNNENGDTLFAKLKGIVDGMGLNFHTFQAVSGYFRSSGYFKLRNELKDTQKIQVLVGIDIDNVFRKSQREGLMFFGDKEDAKRQYTKAFIDDIRSAGYTKDIEDGILQLCDDVISGKLELRVHSSRNLHAKFYLCLPENHGPNTDGWVIMGSSNLTDSGLGTSPSPRYELNVAMKDYDDVAYCKAEFDRLWSEGVPITEKDIAKAKAKTYLGHAPTPFEIFMRVLIDLYGDFAEDSFVMDVPADVRDLKYQRDAVVQGYQLLRRYDGFFLGDVVGLGKTIVAVMIAKRFMAENGERTKILVVYPPAVEDNWKATFRKFGITKRQVHFVSNGSLHKVLDEDNGEYLSPTEYDLVIVDESHGFRNTRTETYNRIQRICKSPRPVGGFVPGRQKKIILVTATALNNTPEDLLNQIRLFQDDRTSTIDGVRDIAGFFAPLSQSYKREMRRAKDTGKVDTAAIDRIYGEIRTGILEKIFIRRTRQNILNDAEYSKDIAAQGIVFPMVEPPNEILYKMDDDLAELFKETNRKLTDLVEYARYRAIEFLKPEHKKKYPHAKQVADILSKVYKVFMVKRLESSFVAFKKSLATFCRITQDMIDMFAADSVLIIPDLDVTGYIEQGKTFEEIIEIAINRRGHERGDIAYPADAFEPELLELLKNDLAVLQILRDDWAHVSIDPKLDRFVELLESEAFDPARNKGGKLVVFSESTDTLEHLERELPKRLGRADVLRVDSSNRAALRGTVAENFDANFPGEKKDDFNILLCSDTLAEGVNLHRSNIIVNYDSPWNATRLMQRIGRVNRIGSSAGAIYNYLFYPSTQGNEVIGLYQYSLIKMQGFHSALGEDAQIYSREELLRQFHLYNANPKDPMDDMIRFMRILRDFRKKEPEWYERIKALPQKCRALRSGKDGKTLVYLANNRRTAFYAIKRGELPRQLSSVEILKLLEASPDEKPLPWTSETQDENYSAVRDVLSRFQEGSELVQESEESLLAPSGRLSKPAAVAGKFLRECVRNIADGILDASLKPKIADLESLLKRGRFVHLERELYRLGGKYHKQCEYDSQELVDEIETLHETYKSSVSPDAPTTPEEPLTLVVSETIAKE